jgi:hypothetical protein
MNDVVSGTCQEALMHKETAQRAQRDSKYKDSLLQYCNFMEGMATPAVEHERQALEATMVAVVQLPPLRCCIPADVRRCPQARQNVPLLYMTARQGCQNCLVGLHRPCSAADLCVVDLPCRGLNQINQGIGLAKRAWFKIFKMQILHHGHEIGSGAN